MLAARRSDPVVLRVIRVEDRIAVIFEQRAMPGIRPGLEGRVHAAAARASDGRVESVGHHLEFLNRIDVGSKLPGSADADRRAIERETVGALYASIHDVFAISVPTPRAGKAGDAELFLREQHTRREVHQHVNLPPVQRVLRGLDRIEVEPPGSIRARHLDHVGGYGDRLGYVAQLKDERRLELLCHHEGHVWPDGLLETFRTHFDVVRARLQVG